MLNGGAGAKHEIICLKTLRASAHALMVNKLCSLCLWDSARAASLVYMQAMIATPAGMSILQPHSERQA